MPVQTRSQKRNKERAKVESAPSSSPPSPIMNAPSSPEPASSNAIPFQIYRVYITYEGLNFSVPANAYIPVKSFISQVVQYFRENFEISAIGDPIPKGSFALLTADGTPPSREDETLGGMLREMNARRPMNPIIFRLNLFRKMQITVRTGSATTVKHPLP